MPHHTGALMQMRMRRNRYNKSKQIQKKKVKRNTYIPTYPIYHEPPSDIYTGDTNSLGEYHGFGKLSTYNFTYIGGWKNNKRHGFGVESYKSGYYDIYACSWVNDTIHGIGEIKKKGKVFFGFFYLKANDTNIYVLRRSRRLAKYPPENKGLVFKNKKRIFKKSKRYKQSYSIYTNSILVNILVLLILRLILYS